jgi:hypothetical protein
MKQFFAMVAVAAIAYGFGSYNDRLVTLAYEAGKAAGYAIQRPPVELDKRQIAELCTKWWFIDPPNLKGKYVSKRH